MADVIKFHHNSLAHHVRQAQVWLADSEEGEHTAFLSYAALELRFAVERLAVHYWATLLCRKPEESDLREIESFKRVERRIYELGGHQQEINAHFEFMRVIMEAMGIDLPFHTPDIGVLSKYWHDCSELCHVGWPLSCTVPAARKQAYAGLVEAAATLEAQAKSLGWPTLKDESFAALRDGFVAGQVSRDEVLAWARERGIWAQVKVPGAGPVPYGTPIAASSDEPESGA